VETTIEAGISNLTIVSNKIFTLETGNRYRYGINLEKNIVDAYCAANHILRAGTSAFSIGASCARITVDSFGGGALPAPALPASGQLFTNPYPTPVTIYLSGGAVKDVLLDNTSTGLASGSFLLGAGKTITLIYNQPPAWAWISQ
jgi:hypothetical protein